MRTVSIRHARAWSECSAAIVSSSWEDDVWRALNSTEHGYLNQKFDNRSSIRVTGCFPTCHPFTSAYGEHSRRYPTESAIQRNPHGCYGISNFDEGYIRFVDATAVLVSYLVLIVVRTRNGVPAMMHVCGLVRGYC